MNITGAYTNSVSPPVGCEWTREGWQKKSRAIADDWTDWNIGISSSVDHPMAKYMNKLKSREFLELDLYDFYEPDRAVWESLKLILELHCIVDESFRRIGILYPENPDFSSVFVQTQYMLVLRGTISRISKHHGIVIPKMRTPKLGLTLRSLSHYLTFHDTEVEIAWYSGPWVNIDENKVNILIVPWPYSISAKDFSYESSINEEISSRASYFYYSPGNNRFINELDHLIEQIKHLMREVLDKVHILAFPEMSLRPNELKLLQSRLADSFEPYQIPMIIAGVSDAYRKEDMQNKSQRSFNRVILSGYYSLKWFDIIQHKHHRWRIDPEQAANYQLDGVLTGADEWWESINIHRRKISFFAPNAWLTICPLICEDLARLEPVSEIIRGVGPTLITALLLDGPQIKERWPARYATIFADDPGSSVLTLTALGLVRRSNDGFRLREGGRVDNQYVALWKDEINGHQSIDVADESKSNNVILSVKGEWGEEYTADNRLDNEITAQLVLKNIYETDFSNIQVKETLTDTKNGQQKNSSLFRTTLKKERKESTSEITELSLSNYAIDLSLDITDNSRVKLIHDLCMDLGFTRSSGYYSNLESGSFSDLKFAARASLVEIIHQASLEKYNFPSPHYLYSIRVAFKDLILINILWQKKLKDLDKNNESYKSQARLLRHKLIFDRCQKALKMTLERISLIAHVARSGSKKYDIDLMQQEDSKGRLVGDLVSTFFNQREKVLYKANELHEAKQEKTGQPITGVKTELIESFDLSEIARIHLAVPITILLSLHKRYSFLRRTEGLTNGQISLIESIEKEFREMKIKDDWRENSKSLKNFELPNIDFRGRYNRKVLFTL